jgi:sugar/nucleoside kinase (ribokinase family)
MPAADSANQSTAKKFDISVVGELNLDLVLYGLPATLEPEREHLASGMQLTLGSSAAIFAHNIAVLGNRVAFHSAVGEDNFAALCLQRLAESGLDASNVKSFPGQQTGLTVILPTGLRRFILTYPGVMAEMRFEDLNLDAVFSARHLHLPSYFLQAALRPKVGELFRLAKQAGLSTSLDTNDDPSGEWASDLLGVLKHVDILLPNEGEACRIARNDNPLSALDHLATLVPLVVMKRGEKGVLARQGSRQFEATPQKVQPVDTIGAGDSFDAGFLHEFLRGSSIENCLEFANKTGALSTTRPGGTEAFRDAAHRQSFLAS